MNKRSFKYLLDGMNSFIYPDMHPDTKRSHLEVIAEWWQKDWEQIGDGLYHAMDTVKEKHHIK